MNYAERHELMDVVRDRDLMVTKALANFRAGKQLDRELSLVCDLIEQHGITPSLLACVNRDGRISDLIGEPIAVTDTPLAAVGKIERWKESHIPVFVNTEGWGLSLGLIFAAKLMFFLPIPGIQLLAIVVGIAGWISAGWSLAETLSELGKRTDKLRVGVRQGVAGFTQGAGLGKAPSPGDDFSYEALEADKPSKPTLIDKRIKAYKADQLRTLVKSYNQGLALLAKDLKSGFKTLNPEGYVSVVKAMGYDIRDPKTITEIRKSKFRDTGKTAYSKATPSELGWKVESVLKASEACLQSKSLVVEIGKYAKLLQKKAKELQQKAIALKGKKVTPSDEQKDKAKKIGEDAELIIGCSKIITTVAHRCAYSALQLNKRIKY